LPNHQKFGETFFRPEKVLKSPISNSRYLYGIFYGTTGRVSKRERILFYASRGDKLMKLISLSKNSESR
jgi:hypothetical protein